MALPTLHSEFVCLQNLQEILQKRLDLEREYTSSLAAWHTAAHKTGPRSTHALHVAFLSLVEAAENDIQARQSMEVTFRSQIDRVLAAMEEFGGHCERITACSEKLEEFDALAKEALENRKLRHEEWKTWKPKPIPSTAVWLWSKPRNEPVPTKRAMVTAYNRADIAVRQYVSRSEVARCSFKDKVMAQVDAIPVAYQVVINTITKCLRLFAENQQECASHTSAGAGRIIKVASDTFGFRLAGAFQETLVSEAQDISTYFISYDDLRYPTIHSQPIILGFSLPQYYFPYTTSTKCVVDVFCQLVSFVSSHQRVLGPIHYATRPPPRGHSLVPIFSELEQSWTRDETVNRDLLRSLGPTTCAQLVKALLESFPEPLIDCSELPAEHLRLWNPDLVHRPGTTWAVPSDQEGGTAPVPFVPRLYNRPQGEMLRALCVSLAPVCYGISRIENEICEIFSHLLTRKGECIKYELPDLVREFSTIITPFDPKIAVPRGTSDDLCKTSKTTLRRSVSDLSVHPVTPQPYDPMTTSDIESRRAIISMATNKAHTILLVGGNGAGKPSLVNFIANTLLSGDNNYYNHPNEFLRRLRRLGTWPVSPSPWLYEIESELGVLIRILKTPMPTGTRDVVPNELRKESIVASVEKHLDSVTAVLIHADSTELTGDDMDYALSTLSTILPKTLANNIAFVFTGVSTPSLQGLSVPEVFKGAPSFVFSTLERESFLSHPSQDERRAGTRGFWKVGEESALDILVKLFNWMDSLNPQPATEIVYLFEKYQHIKAWVNNTLTQMNQATEKKAEINRLMIRFKRNSTDMDSFSNFEKTVDMSVSKQQPITTRKINKQVLVNQDMKKKWETAKKEKEKTAALIAVNEMVLHDLKQAISRAPNNLAPLLEQYARLSLTGSFSVQTESTVKFLGQKYIVMTEAGVYGLEESKLKESLNQMKRELELLDNAKEIGQQEGAEIETYV